MLREAGGCIVAREDCLQEVASGWAVEDGEGLSKDQENSGHSKRKEYHDLQERR